MSYDKLQKNKIPFRNESEFWESVKDISRKNDPWSIQDFPILKPSKFLQFWTQIFELIFESKMIKIKICLISKFRHLKQQETKLSIFILFSNSLERFLSTRLKNCFWPIHVINWNQISKAILNLLEYFVALKKANFWVKGRINI